jgi:hypothetical protein
MTAPVEPPTAEPVVEPISTGLLKIRIIPWKHRPGRDSDSTRSSLPGPGPRTPRSDASFDDVVQQGKDMRTSLYLLAGTLGSLTDRVDSMANDVKNTREYIHSLEADEKIGRQRNDDLEESLRALKKQNVGTTSRLSTLEYEHAVLKGLEYEHAVLKVENAARTAENSDMNARLSALEAASTRRKTF